MRLSLLFVLFAFLFSVSLHEVKNVNGPAVTPSYPKNTDYFVMSEVEYEGKLKISPESWNKKTF